MGDFMTHLDQNLAQEISGICDSEADEVYYEGSECKSKQADQVHRRRCPGHAVEPSPGLLAAGEA